MPTQDQFYQALHGYLPEGLIWPDMTEDAVINTLIEHIAANTKAVDDDATAEFEDVFPDNTTNYIDDWERVLSLPKTLAAVTFFKCDVSAMGDPLSSSSITTPMPSTDQERLDIIGAMLNRNPLNNAAFYQSIADIFGLTVIITTGMTPLIWSIQITAGDIGKLDIFTAMVNFFKPAHTQVTIA